MESVSLKNKYVNVYSCCIFVKGYTRAAIYDLQREEIELVPNSLVDFVKYIDKKKTSDIYEEFKDNKDALEYLEFLYSNDFIFDAPEGSKNNFPSLTTYSVNEDTSPLNFVTLYFSDIIHNNLEDIFEKLYQLGVKGLHIHFTEKSEEYLSLILNLIQNTRITYLSVSVPYDSNVNFGAFKHNILKYIYVYNAEDEINMEEDETKIIFSKKAYQFFKKKFSLANLAINHGAYNISLKNNLALYKTIFIDKNGNIRLNGYDKNNYGNIIDHSSKRILNNELLRLSEVWKIKKTSIVPCKFCEFRWVCTANFIPQKKDNYYIVECNYNPKNNTGI
ncbi:hypothetical protein [Chryseobacterium sp. CT-SW4]|uniref:hypothetical protein n=1 Tax=Chryseobacterium sp. SW-1 TaxID=3157343 RepID=UPI003B011ECF